MKKLTCILLAALLALSAVAFAIAEGNAATATATVEENLTRMLPMLDSAVRNMDALYEAAKTGTDETAGETADETTVYDAEDPVFVWNVLYLTARNEWQNNPNAAMSEYEVLTLPEADVLKLAQSCFYGLTELPEVPEQDPVKTQLSDYVGYDADAQVYTFAWAGDELRANEETYIAVNGYAQVGEETYALVTEYLSRDDSQVKSFIVRMGDNLSASLFDEDVLPYAIESVEMNIPDYTTSDGQTLTFTECHMEFGKPAPEAEATPEPTQKPAETTGYSELKQGSRGDAVTKLQKRLTELGYDCGKADGIYGSRTSRAVRFFQDALGVSQTGRASGEMQQKLFSANAPEYVHYVLLKKGSSGVRVEDLQARLRKLGYLANPVDGQYGETTKKAVALFQKDAGLKVDGSAGKQTLKALESKKAPHCKAYITLKKGDTGDRVTEMQKRLVELGLLEKANGSYNRKTVAAVKAFLELIGQDGNGKTATPETIQAMFDYKPAEPTPAPTEAPATEAPATEAPATEAPTTEAPATEAPATEAPTTEAPPAEPTEAPTTEAPATEAPTTEAPATEAPATEAPATDAPVEPTAAPLEAITEEQMKTFITAVQTVLNDNTLTKSDCIVWLQARLTGSSRTGFYDAETVELVKAVQIKLGLTGEMVNGVAGEDVITSLKDVTPAK